VQQIRRNDRFPGFECGATGGAHHESLQSQVIVHRDLNVLLGPQIALGGLYRGVPQQEFDLLQIPAVLPAQFRASPAEVMRAEVLDPDLLG
jgi:hypothetical protein